MTRLARSATGRLRDQAAELIRAGRDVIDLTAGELADATAGHIVEAAARAAADPASHHYGPVAGDPALRSVVADWAAGRLSQPVDPETVLITNGAKQALFNALATLLRPGDEVIVAAPTWPTFPAAVTLAGGTPVIAPPDPELLLSGVEAFESVRSSATRAVIVTSPHNPTGLTYSPAAVRSITDWALERDLWLIADDDVALAERLLEDGGVATVPGSAFGCHGHLRLSYAGPADIVETGLDRIVGSLLSWHRP